MSLSDDTAISSIFAAGDNVYIAGLKVQFPSRGGVPARAGWCAVHAARSFMRRR